MPKEQLHAVQNAILTEKHCLFLKRKNKFFSLFHRIKYSCSGCKYVNKPVTVILRNYTCIIVIMVKVKSPLKVSNRASIRKDVPMPCACPLTLHCFKTNCLKFYFSTYRTNI